MMDVGHIELFESNQRLIFKTYIENLKMCKE